MGGVHQFYANFMPFYIRELSTPGFWHLCRSFWKLSLTDASDVQHQMCFFKTYHLLILDAATIWVLAEFIISQEQKSTDGTVLWLGLGGTDE